MSTSHIRLLEKYGIRLDGARGFVDRGPIMGLAQDAAPLQVVPSATAPVEPWTYWSTETINILTAKRTATQLIQESRPAGLDSNMDIYKFRTSQQIGSVAPYSDFAEGGDADVQYNWFHREQYEFQTEIKWGAKEAAKMSLAGLNVAAERQEAAAELIAVTSNKYYLRGVAGKNIYGFLNDPDLPDAIQPLEAPRGSGSTVISWQDKTSEEIYGDVLHLFGRLLENSEGHISPTDPLTLALSNRAVAYLGKANQYNVSVKTLLSGFFSSLQIVTCPELRSEAGVELVYLYTRQLAGQPTAELVFGEKFHGWPLVALGSSYRQKFSASTLGFILRRPLAFARMAGIEEDV